MPTILTEGQKEFKAWCNDDELAKRFLDTRSKLPAPENNMDWWVSKKNGKTPQDLKDFLDNYQSKTSKEKQEREEGAEKIYNDDNWTVIHLTTYKAAAQYGKGSKWCICGNYPGHETKGEYWFNNYLSGGGNATYTGYYVYINKKPNDPTQDGKYMVCPKIKGGIDIWNQADHTIPFIPNGPSIEGLPVGQFSVIDGRLVDCKLLNKYDDNEIEIPNGVRSIKYRLFMEKSLHEVKLPDSLETIEAGSFAATKLEEVSLPNNVKNLGVGAFMGCEKLSEVSIGKGITSLPKNCFAYCDALIRVWVFGDLKEVDPTAFLEAGLNTANHRITFHCETSGGKNNALIEYASKNQYEVVDIKSGEIVNAKDIDYED